MSRISITKLYDDLSAKLGKENAENLTTYIDYRIDSGMENKSKILATKDDISRLVLATKDDIARLILATKEEISRFERATKDDFSRLEGKISETNIKVCEINIKLSETISETKSDLIQWMVGICIALVAMILGLYFKN